jgi:WD40 repeat protein
MDAHGRRDLVDVLATGATAGRMWSAAFSPDGKEVVTADDKVAQVWDARTHQLRFTLPHGDAIYDARYSAGGAQLVTAGGDGIVRIRVPATGALVRELRHDGPSRSYYATALSPDGKFIAAIINEYAEDAITELGVRTGFLPVDREWVRTHSASSLPDIEKATLRLVAIRESRNLSAAAARLGMAPVSLSRWIGRRKLRCTSGRDAGAVAGWR